MLDQVRNPEDQFSHNEAHFFYIQILKTLAGLSEAEHVGLNLTPKIGFLATGLKYEPRCEKTDLWGFRPGLTQTRLYTHKQDG